MIIANMKTPPAKATSASRGWGPDWNLTPSTVSVKRDSNRKVVAWISMVGQKYIIGYAFPIPISFVTAKLLTANRGMLETNRKTLESMRLSFYGSTWQGIVSNHREMYFGALDPGSQDLLDMMFLRKGDRLDHELSKRERIMATIVINHAEACFLHLKFGTLPNEVKEPIERGLVTLFGNPAIRKVWESVRPEYRVREFRDFVNRLISEAEAAGGGQHQ